MKIINTPKEFMDSTNTIFKIEAGIAESDYITLYKDNIRLIQENQKLVSENNKLLNMLQNAQPRFYAVNTCGQERKNSEISR